MLNSFSDNEALQSTHAPVTEMLSSRLMVLANLLKRGAELRYRRTVGLSSVEFGLVASLGYHPPMSVIQLANAVGRDKGQVSRALSPLIERGLVSRKVNPKDNREVLVVLTAKGRRAHDDLLAGAHERSAILLQGLPKRDVQMLQGYIEHLTRAAEGMLHDEQGR